MFENNRVCVKVRREVGNVGYHSSQLYSLCGVCVCAYLCVFLTWEMWLMEDSMRRSCEAWMSSSWSTLLAKALIW